MGCRSSIARPRSWLDGSPRVGCSAPTRGGASATAGRRRLDPPPGCTRVGRDGRLVWQVERFTSRSTGASMSLDDPVIITCSISGAVANRDQCPAIPYTPEEYAAEARRIVDEGGSHI